MPGNNKSKIKQKQKTLIINILATMAKIAKIRKQVFTQYKLPAACQTLVKLLLLLRSEERSNQNARTKLQ